MKLIEIIKTMWKKQDNERGSWEDNFFKWSFISKKGNRMQTFFLKK